MELQSLHTRLNIIQHQHDHAMQNVNKTLKNNREQQQTIQFEIQNLQQRLIDLQQQEQTLQDDVRTHAIQCAEEQRDGVVATLHESLNSILISRDYWATRADLEYQYQSFLASDPELLIKVDAYRKVESNIEEYLQNLPKIHQDVIEQKQKELHAYIAPFLAIESRLSHLRLEHPIYLQVAVIETGDDGRIHWIMPFPANPSDLPDDAEPVLSHLADAVITCLGSFGKYDDWTIDHIDAANWEGFAMLVTVAYYSGTTPLEVAAQSLLHEQLSIIPMMQSVPFDIRIDHVPPVAWKCGRPDVSLVAESPDEEEDQQDVELPDSGIKGCVGWFTDHDLRAWNRAKKQIFSSQPSRLRTLLIRMVGRGMIGGKMVPVEDLYEALPVHEALEMRYGIDTLIRNGVLLSSASSEENNKGVSINPALMTEVQYLINREIDDFWETVFKPTH